MASLASTVSETVNVFEELLCSCFAGFRFMISSFWALRVSVGGFQKVDIRHGHDGLGSGLPLGLYRGYIGIMEKKMETTTMGLYRV